MKTPVYLDYNATAPARPTVVDEMREALRLSGNASSVHRYGRAARALVEKARSRVAELIGARPEQVVFTSGGTEANNLALAGFGGWRVFVTAIEHDSVIAAAPDGERLPVGADGTVDLSDLVARLARGGEGALVSIMLANNETGVIQPVAEAARIAHEAGAFLHTDAVQAVGKIAADFDELGVDAMTISAHKFGGPPGVGALIVRDGYPLIPLLKGGGQERRRRAGTENVPAIAGFGAAAELAARGLEEFARLAALRDTVEERIRAVSPNTRIFGKGAARLPNTSCFTMPGVKAETQVIALDLAGYAVSAGSACSSGRLEPSHVLAAMGATEAEASTAIRVSLGWRTARAEVDGFVAAWRELFHRAGEGARSARPAA